MMPKYYIYRKPKFSNQKKEGRILAEDVVLHYDRSCNLLELVAGSKKEPRGKALQGRFVNLDSANAGRDLDSC